MNNYDDWAFDQAIQDLHFEAVMDRATKEQCIYLFVEGTSEERAFPILLEQAGIELDSIGVVVANYNGCRNLVHALRLLYKTLSSDRPVIATIDNDQDGKQILNRIHKDGNHFQGVDFFIIPSEPVVEYPSGHKGGSFEEIFDKDIFIECCFSEVLNEDEIIPNKKEFLRSFNPNKPWYPQVQNCFAAVGNYNFSKKKASLAELLAETSKKVPSTIIALAELIRTVRDEYPVKHPDDVVLPKIPGLTSFKK